MTGIKAVSLEKQLNSKRKISQDHKMNSGSSRALKHVSAQYKKVEPKITPQGKSKKIQSEKLSSPLLQNIAI